MRQIATFFLIIFVTTSCRARQNESTIKTSDDVVTEEEVASYWIRYLNDPASFFPDVIEISDEIKIPKSKITDYTIEYGSDRYKYAQIAAQPSFLMLDNGEALSMFCDGQNSAREPFLGGTWDGEFIYRMRSFMAPKLYQVRRFIPDRLTSNRVQNIVTNWKSLTGQGKEFVYRAFSDDNQESFVIQLIGRLEAKDQTSYGMFYSVSDSHFDGFLNQTIAKQLQVDPSEVQRMFESRMLKNVSSDKKAFAIGFRKPSEDVYWKPFR